MEKLRNISRAFLSDLLLEISSRSRSRPGFGGKARESVVWSSPQRGYDDCGFFLDSPRMDSTPMGVSGGSPRRRKALPHFLLDEFFLGRRSGRHRRRSGFGRTRKNSSAS